MIQDIKNALVAYLQPLQGAGGLLEGVVTVTDSEIATQPTASSPIVQIVWNGEAAPVGIKGIGSATTFSYATQMAVFLKSTGPFPLAHRNLYPIWLRRDPVTQNLRGLRVALQQLVATGLAVAGSNFQVKMGDPRPLAAAQLSGKEGVYTVGISVLMTFEEWFDG